LHPLFFFFERFCTQSFAPFPSFNDDFEQNKIDKRWGAKSLKKRGGAKSQLAKDRGESAIKPFIFFPFFHASLFFILLFSCIFISLDLVFRICIIYSCIFIFRHLFLFAYDI